MADEDPIVGIFTSLDDQKKERNRLIDRRTDELISLGFAFDGEQFSLSQNAQINWLALKTVENLLTWPVSVSTLQSNQYMLEEDDLDGFLGAGSGTAKAHLDSGRALKVQINDATTQEELDAVVDNR